LKTASALRAIPFLCCLLGVLAVASACSTLAPIVQSPNDDRQYDHFVLENGLSVVLISDSSADKAAAALTVFSGSFSDPPGRLGLAHFLEHMLFLGTEKYPKPDEYQAFIAGHGGTHNAYTAGDHTNFFFDVQPAYFEEALDRFAQFFIAPTFDAAYVDREKNAVNSEYQLYFKDDDRREQHVDMIAMNPDHPGSRFGIGSLETLAGDVRSDLVRFYQTHYSANRMALVVLGPQSLDQLRTWAQQKFSAIPKRETAPALRFPSLYAPGTLPERLTFQTIKDVRELNFTFPVPSPDPYYREKPGEYIANLLGHEGEGSLHQFLKARGWIESLTAEAGRVDSTNGAISVSFELTQAGAQHTVEITAALFDEIDLIKRKGIEQWRYDEQARVADLAFRFQEKQSPIATVYRLAPELRLYPAQDVLVAPYLMSKFDEGLIKRYLAALRPDNVLIEVANPDVKGVATEPWFKVPYALERIDAPPHADIVGAAVSLPQPNPFLPSRLELIGRFDDTPTLAVDDPGLQLWLARDTSFGTPRANLFLELNIEGGIATEDDAVNANLYARLVADQLNTFTYPAQLAGLDYGISAAGPGFKLSISGFNDKQAVLLARVLAAFSQLKVDDSRLALYKAEFKRELDNFVTERPFEQAYSALTFLLPVNAWPPAVLARRIDAVTPDTLSGWAKARLSRIDVTGLLHGNADASAAQAIGEAVRGALPLAAFPPFEPRIIAPHALLRHRLDIANDNAALVLYVQGREPSFQERARYGLAAQILAAPYFNDLRTEQQLGYAVFTTPALIRRTPGIAFVVQSPVAGPAALVDASLRFLSAYRSTAAQMSDEEFATQRQSLATKLTERDKNLAARGARLWSDLDLGFTTFDSHQQIANAALGIDKASFLKFYDELLERIAKERLIVYSPGRFDGAAPPGADIGDIEGFKHSVTPIQSPVGTPAARPRATARTVP